MRDGSLVLLVLILANMLLDFGRTQWRERRRQPFTTLQNGLMTVLQGAGVAALLYAFNRSGVPALMAGIVFALSWAAIRWLMAKVQSPFAFVLQFFLQVMVLTVIWLTAQGYWHWALDSTKALFNARNLLFVLGYVLVLRPTGALIGAVLTPWLASVSSKGSLKKAGTLIGYLERALILTFVLLDQWGAIGFLLTAKSILRFNDIKGDEQRSLSEYVLLGTLVSFAVSIAVGLTVLKLAGK